MSTFYTTFIPYDRKHNWIATLEKKIEKQQEEILQKIAAGKDICMLFPKINENKLSLFEVFDHEEGYKVGFWVEEKKTYLSLPKHPCAEDVAMRFIEASEALYTLYGEENNNEEENNNSLDEENEES